MALGQNRQQKQLQGVESESAPDTVKRERAEAFEPEMTRQMLETGQGQYDNLVVIQTQYQRIQQTLAHSVGMKVSG